MYLVFVSCVISSTEEKKDILIRFVADVADNHNAILEKDVAASQRDVIERA